MELGRTYYLFWVIFDFVFAVNCLIEGAFASFYSNWTVLFANLFFGILFITYFTWDLEKYKNAQ